MIDDAVVLAEQLLRRADATTTPAERRAARRLARLLDDVEGRELLFALTDEVLRIPDGRRAMRRLRQLVRPRPPASLPPLDRAALWAAATASRLAPRPVAAVVRRRLRAETRAYVVDAADPAFARHVAERTAASMRVNVNVLGEAVLGDGEAASRADAVRRRLRRPDVDYVSVKVSALCANLDVLAFDHEVDRISQQLRSLFRAALARTRHAAPPAFVNLDMEEFRDLGLTVAAFRQVLDEPEFLGLPAGVALQAYLPDSHAVLEDLCRWAAARRARGGVPPKVRLVKGANLAMERVEAEMTGWPAAPYGTKGEVDASYKALMDRAFEAAAAGDLRVGVGSHNLFDVARALVARSERGLQPMLDVEVLEGMAPAQARAVRDVAGSLVVYTPVVAADDLAAGIAYLARRLDENAGEDNFLRALFTLAPGTSRWQVERLRFDAAVAERGRVRTTSHRVQDRRTERIHVDPDAVFVNEVDTDFTRPANRQWIAHHLATTRPAPRPPTLATTDDVDELVERALRGARGWAATSWSERREVLARAATAMAAARGRTVAVMAAETAKTVHEGDVEVSEAVDFARWAIDDTRRLEGWAQGGLRVDPLGVVVVAGPWNFPYAIPANGVLSALATGNAVLLKPAPEAVATAAELVAQLHDGGVPREALQLVVCPDGEVGTHLVTHHGVDRVVLTGSIDTAKAFLDADPHMDLVAETSGKNAMVISTAADVDLAVRDLVRSAFGHAGQKCSAASLVIFEGALAADPAVLNRLGDAVRSVRVGPAPEPATMMGPLIGPPGEKLARGLGRLDAGERWLVEPRPLDAAGRRWSPGVRVGIRAGSWFHGTECFGPVLGVMTAADLDEAIELQNGTEFGLTGGLHTLDPDEVAHWTGRVEVGNAYVNRHITGAIVGRQPFGGWKRSSVGPGAKTGGPEDLLRFVRIRDGGGAGPVAAAAVRAGFAAWWATGTAGVDRAGLRPESNVLRRRPGGPVLVRAGLDTAAAAMSVVRAAAEVTGTQLALAGVEEDDAAVVAQLSTGRFARLRLLTGASDAVVRAAHRAGTVVDPAPAVPVPDVELPRWCRTQVVTATRHRHGRLMSPR